MIFFSLFFNKSGETSEGKVAKCVPFVERLYEGGCAGWRERALKSLTKGFKAQQYPLAGDGYHLHPLPLPPRHAG